MKMILMIITMKNTNKDNDNNYNDDANYDDDANDDDVQVCEDYEEDEREKYNEELFGIKRRFSHPKVKRKWVSIEYYHII